MDKITLKEYRQRCWQVAEVFKNDVKIATVNRFYDVNADWIIIYETVGGSGYGYKPGNVIQRIYIGASEFKREVSYQ